MGGLAGRDWALTAVGLCVWLASSQVQGRAAAARCKRNMGPCAATRTGGGAGRSAAVIQDGVSVIQAMNMVNERSNRHVQHHAARIRGRGLSRRLSSTLLQYATHATAYSSLSLPCSLEPQQSSSLSLEPFIEQKRKANKQRKKGF
jgi:predicted GNAT family acetyltransferase